MSVAGFIASQRTDHDVPHTLACRALGVSESWFYKWRDRPPTARERRRAEIDAMVKASFDDSGGTYGSPRVLDDLRDAGERVSKKTVEASMARQGLVARPRRRRKNLTRPDKRAVPFPDLVRRDFTAEAPDVRWVGDMTEIPTGEGKLYLATVEDLFSRRTVGFALSEHPDAALARAAIYVAVAVRGGHVEGSCSTPTGARPTPPMRSPAPARSWGSSSPWDGSGRASTATPRPNRSSPPSSTSCSAARRSRPAPRPAGPSPSSSSATTPAAATAPPAGDHPSTTNTHTLANTRATT